MADNQGNQVLSTSLNTNGEVTATTTLTRDDNTQRCEMIFRNKIIPVVVIPGIMGTNLKFAKDVGDHKEGAPAWGPPNGMGDSVAAVNVWSKRSPADRQRILNLSTTTVHNTDEIEFPSIKVIPIKANNRKDMIDAKLALYRDKRFWGELHKDSYGGFLAWLEDTLNQEPVPGRANWEDELLANTEGHGSQEKNKPTDKSQLEYATCYRYPVYAYGYNWLESNAVSAEKLDARIDKILADCQKQDPSCNKVILITHSMGGLVARAYTKQSMEKVLGVVHGVMPATGAPVFYKRLRAGFGGESEDGMFVRGISKIITGHGDPVAAMLGPDAAATAAVVANAPGALELAPWGNYNNGKPWLRVVNTVNQEQFSIGGDAIYADVYANTSAWYGMLPLREKEVDGNGNNIRYDPAGLVREANPEEALTDVFKQQVKKVRVFQQEHAHFYPSPCAVFWGKNSGTHSTYKECVWEGNIPLGIDAAALRTAELVEDNLQGTITLQANGKAFSLKLRRSDGHGEGTVPIESAMAAKDGAIATFEQPGYNHQMSYGNTHARWAVLYSIVQFVKDDPRCQ